MKRSAAVALFCATLVVLPATPAIAAVDLLQAWDAARAHDPEFAAASAQRDAGQARARQGRALLLPQVVATAGTSYATDDRDVTGARFTAPGFGEVGGVGFHTRVANGQSTSWALALQQTLFSAARLSESDTLALQADAAQQQYAGARQKLMLDTATDYLNVVYAQERLAAMQAHKAALDEAQAAAQALFDEGRAPVTEAAEARAQRDEIDADLVSAQNDLEVSRAAFTLRTGLPAFSLEPVREDLAGAWENGGGRLEDWLGRAVAGNPAMLQQRVNRDIARKQIDRYKALRSPSLDLVARVGEDRLWGQSGWGPSSITAQSRYVGVQLTVPVFTGGMRGAQYDETVALAERAQGDLEATANAVSRQTRAAWLAADSADQRLRARQRAHESALLRLDATRTGREVGARTLLDELNARADEMRTRLALVRERHAWILDRLRLAAAAGELTDDALSRANALLAPSNQ